MYGHDQYQRDYITELAPLGESRLWDKLSPFYKVTNITTPLFMGAISTGTFPSRRRANVSSHESSVAKPS